MNEKEKDELSIFVKIILLIAKIAGLQIVLLPLIISKKVYVTTCTFIIIVLTTSKDRQQKVFYIGGFML
jgi:hypothetical protein